MGAALAAVRQSVARIGMDDRKDGFVQTLGRQTDLGLDRGALAGVDRDPLTAASAGGSISERSWSVLSPAATTQVEMRTSRAGDVAGIADGKLELDNGIVAVRAGAHRPHQEFEPRAAGTGVGRGGQRLDIGMIGLGEVDLLGRRQRPATSATGDSATGWATGRGSGTGSATGRRRPVRPRRAQRPSARQKSAHGHARRGRLVAALLINHVRSAAAEQEEARDYRQHGETAEQPRSNAERVVVD